MRSVILVGLACCALVVMFFGKPAHAQTDCSCWIDVKTGTPVPTIPSGALYTETSVRPGTRITQTLLQSGVDPGDPNAAHNPNTGQSFVRQPDGGWIDAKTGQCVPTIPSGALYTETSVRPGTRITQTLLQSGVDPGDPNAAHNPNTGQSFARVPCPPPPTPVTAGPPDETQPQSGSPEAPPSAPAQQAPSGGVSVPSFGFGFGGFGHGSDRGGSKGDSR